jgi:uncharacterized protein (TIGR01370 family)
MLVLEPTRTDRGDRDFDTPGMVTQLKNSMASDGTHRKLVVACIDIGGAEDYCFYWQEGWTSGDPAWLDVENPDCGSRGNHNGQQDPRRQQRWHARKFRWHS